MNEKKKFTKPEMKVEELQIALYKSNLELQKSNQKLKELELKRNEMFSNISHDLRAPLTAMKSSVEYLEKIIARDEEVDFVLNLLDSRISSMKEMVEDIFLLTTIENGKGNFKLIPIEANLFLEEIFSMFEADSYFNNRKLELNIEKNSNNKMNIDPEKLKRAIDNLVYNAYKFTFEGDNINFRLKSEKGYVIITIEDTGIGISKEDQQRIFDRTYTVQDARTPGKSGCGLGLSIVKSIVEHMDGKVEVESSLGKGSSFKIYLPVIK